MSQMDALWRVNDVARYLQASRSWVYQKAEAGTLPCLRLGGLLRFDPQAVRDFAQGKRTQQAKVLSLSVPSRS